MQVNLPGTVLTDRCALLSDSFIVMMFGGETGMLSSF